VPSKPGTASGRRAYIDVARGIAVLLMIEAHTTDAWTRAASKTSVAFRNATVLGGFAAPLFLWLAGIGAALSAARAWQKTGSRAAVVDAIARRGLEIFVLAFLFRLQAFIVSPGGSPLMLFRVDILNIMGPAIAFAGVLWLAAGSARGRAAAFSIAAVIVALVTPIVRGAAFVDALPTWVQWYLRPAGEHTTFTAFPWIGFVFAGAAAGSLAAAIEDDRDERRLHIACAAVGAALIALGFVTAARPSLYAESSFWTSSPTWFAIRVGIMMIALTALYAARTAGPAVDVIAHMGRASLFIYWIHVELVYGYASWLWRGRLPLWATALAYVAFSLLMYGAVVARDRYWPVVLRRSQAGGRGRRLPASIE
jgi:uncharacterized membrane protein